MFYDGNKANFHPSNLVWKFPSEGVECDNFPGFYYIPNLTRYAISKDGILVHVPTRRFPNPSTHARGYVYYWVMPDVKTKKGTTIGRHRLLGMTFLPNSPFVDVLEVNHLDGVPGNDKLENLEWVSRSDNAKHAFKNNLRTDNKAVVVTDHNTGETTKFFSVHECERALGLTRSVVHYRLKTGAGKIYPPGLSFAYLDKEYKQHTPDKFGVKVLLKTPEGMTLTFDSISKCAKHLGISKKVIQSRINKTGTCEYKGYYVRRED